MMQEPCQRELNFMLNTQELASTESSALQLATYSSISRALKISKSIAKLLFQESCSLRALDSNFMQQRKLQFSKMSKTVILKRGRQSKFSGEHIQYLTSQCILQRWAGKTLRERCVLFHRVFPEVSISPSALLSLYNKFKIKRKAVYISKAVPMRTQLKKPELLKELQSQVLMSLEQKREIVFIDEVMFTFHTQQTRDYSNLRDNIQIIDQQLSTKTYAVVAAVSLNEGLVCFSIYRDSVDQEKFADFLRSLRFRTANREISLFLDNLRVHHCKQIKELCKDLNIPMIFNLPYSPEYNPIENVFSIVKNYFKRAKINYITNDLKYDAQKLITQSFEKVSKESIQSICESGLQRILK